MAFNQNQILTPITTSSPDLFGRPGKCAYCGFEFNTVQVRSKAYTVVRMDKTAVLCKTVASKKGVADDFLKKIKY